MKEGRFSILAKWSQTYGKVFGYYEGSKPVLVVADPDMVREILIKQFHKFEERNLIFAGVVLQFCVKKQRNKALFWKIKHFFSKNKALLRIKVWVNFRFIFQNLLLNHFYCLLFSSWVLVFPLTICFII